MNTDLTNTTSSQINATLIAARRAIGSPTVGMVLTLVIVTDEGNHYDALKAASQASKEHPSRILVVIRRPGRSPRARAETRLDAEVRVGGDSGTGETVLLRLHGELAHHAQSVVVPLLLPDAPVVVWWPEESPEVPALDALGALGQRRVTDAAACEDPVQALASRAESYTPGDTDLAWTRITTWRSVLAAALDQRHATITSAMVEGEAYNPSSELLALWLADRLRVPVERTVSEGPGLTAVRLYTEHGVISLDRSDGTLAKLAMPGQPDRSVALKRRETSELVAEELRRLDPDVSYAAAVKFGVDQLRIPEPVEEHSVPPPALPANGAGQQEVGRPGQGSVGAASQAPVGTSGNPGVVESAERHDTGANGAGTEGSAPDGPPEGGSTDGGSTGAPAKGGAQSGRAKGKATGGTRAASPRRTTR